MTPAGALPGGPLGWLIEALLWLIASHVVYVGMVAALERWVGERGRQRVLKALRRDAEERPDR